MAEKQVTINSSYEEMKQVFPEFYLKKKVDELKSNFKKYDINGDGTLDFFEVKQMMESLGQPQTHLKVKEMISEATGGKEAISFHDFCKTIHPKKAEAGKKEPELSLFGKIYQTALAEKAKHFETEMAKNKGLSKEELEAQVRSEAEMRKEERKRDKERQVELKKEREEAARKEEERAKSRESFAKMKSNFQ